MLRVFFLIMFIVFVSVAIIFSLKKNGISDVDVYKVVKEDMPYKIEYNFEKGFEILDKRTNSIIQSNDKNVYQKMEELQFDWIKSHIIIHNTKIIILDDNNHTKKEFNVKNSADLEKIKEFFKLK